MRKSFKIMHMILNGIGWDWVIPDLGMQGSVDLWIRACMEMERIMLDILGLYRGSNWLIKLTGLYRGLKIIRLFSDQSSVDQSLHFAMSH